MALRLEASMIQPWMLRTSSSQLLSLISPKSQKPPDPEASRILLPPTYLSRYHPYLSKYVIMHQGSYRVGVGLLLGPQHGSKP